MRNFWLCFVPLFVAVDPIGILPLFLNLTEGIDAARRRRVILQSMMTASIVAVFFLLCGPALLSFLGITVQDFMIAGGLLLLAISLTNLLSGETRQRQMVAEEIGAVPIGVPTTVSTISKRNVISRSPLVMVDSAIGSPSRFAPTRWIPCTT